MLDLDRDSVTYTTLIIWGMSSNNAKLNTSEFRKLLNFDRCLIFLFIIIFCNSLNKQLMLGYYRLDNIFRLLITFPQ